MRGFFCLALVLASGAASAEDQFFFSKTFYGRAPCDGKDHTPILVKPWEPRAIQVRGVSISHRYRGIASSSYAFSGNSSNADVMSPLVLGEGTQTAFYPPGLWFTFPGAVSDPLAPHVHIDAHTYCAGRFAWNSEVWLTVFYTFAPEKPAKRKPR